MQENDIKQHNIIKMLGLDEDFIKIDGAKIVIGDHSATIINSDSVGLFVDEYIKDHSIKFLNCIFKKQVRLANISFVNDIYFDYSIFEDYADFYASKFEKDASFYGVIFKRPPNFSAAIFKDIRGANFVGVSVDGIDYECVEDFIDKQAELGEERYLAVQNIKDSFRTIKDVLINKNDILAASTWHKLELYAKEKELEISLGSVSSAQKPKKEHGKNSYKWLSYKGLLRAVKNIPRKVKHQILYLKHGKNMIDLTPWVNCMMLSIYRKTSDHHTNLLKILNFSVGMIAVYGINIYFISLLCMIKTGDAVFLLFIILISILMLAFIFFEKKIKFVQYSPIVVFIPAALLYILSVIFLKESDQLIAFILDIYILCVILYFIMFDIKCKLIVFLLRFASYFCFAAIVVVEPQLINPFLGVFKTDVLVAQNAINSTSILYSIILLLCIFSLQKTARKNSIVPN